MEIGTLYVTIGWTRPSRRSIRPRNKSATEFACRSIGSRPRCSGRGAYVGHSGHVKLIFRQVATQKTHKKKIEQVFPIDAVYILTIILNSDPLGTFLKLIHHMGRKV